MAGLTRSPHLSEEITMTMLDCRADVYANGRQYTVRAATLPPAGEHGERIEVSLSGLDHDGEQSASGALTLPPDALAPVGRLLQQIMTGLSTLNGRARATTPANARAPWSEDQDNDLMERWLTAGDTHKAGTIHRELAEHFGRTIGSIKARLTKIGCDPEAPGHAFTTTPTEDT
jgi:hypothetical protein